MPASNRWDLIRRKRVNWFVLHYAGLSVPPSSWTIISEDRQTRVLVAKDRELYVLKQSEQHALPVVS